MLYGMSHARTVLAVAELRLKVIRLNDELARCRARIAELEADKERLLDGIRNAAGQLDFSIRMSDDEQTEFDRGWEEAAQ